MNLKKMGKIIITFINFILDGLFWGCSRMGGTKKPPPPPSKICHTCPTMMRLGSYTLPKEDQKTI